MARLIRGTTRALGGAALVAALAVGGRTAAGAADADRACRLLTAAELEAVLGGKVSELAGGGATGTADAALCSGSTPTAAILLRVAKKSARAPGAEAQGLAMAKQMGFQVDVKTFGAITCSSIVPPKGREQAGFNTTCSIDKGGEIAAVEVSAKSQKDMVPIDKLRRLAEKMAGRF